jgi:heterodisulfide reductase subunit A
MSAIKHAMMIKTEQESKSEVYIAYTDIRTFGKGYEEYYKRACEQGVHFIRTKVAEILQDKKKLVARLEDTDLGEQLEIKPDLVVLSTGLIPSEGTQNIAKMLRLECDSKGFLTERHPKLAPVDTKLEGIYICGTAQSPKDIPDSVAQARAAAVGALGSVLKKTIKIDLAKAAIDDELCNSCGLCIDSCPYEAIVTPEAEEEIAVAPVKVIEAMCKSCGICSAECPTGAIQLKHYKGDQILGQIDGICGD